MADVQDEKLSKRRRIDRNAGNGPPLPEPGHGYAIAVSEATAALWPRVIAALVRKHPGASVMTWAVEMARELLVPLREARPRHVCFIAHWKEADEPFVRSVHALTRCLDTATPFSDCIWGILTGADEADALAIAAESQPLVIRHVVSGSVEGCDLRAFESGEAYNELKQGHGLRKSTSAPGPDGGGEAFEITGDSTLQIAAAIENPATDMVITSGHARQTEWNVGFRFPAGQFRPNTADGTLWAHTDARGPDAVRPDAAATGDGAAEAPVAAAVTPSSREIRASTKPKIYSAAGNCLIADINAEHCMALAWMRSAGVRQMVGYIVPTWFGFGGWGVHRYMFGNVGALSFAEAYFANQQALQLRLMQAEAAAELATREAAARELTEKEQYQAGGGGLGLNAGQMRRAEHELRGLRFDAAGTVFYGDPAWEARMAPTGGGYYSIELAKVGISDETAKSGDQPTLFEVKVVTLKPGCWTPTCADDKDTLPGRPPFLLHGRRLGSFAGTGTGTDADAASPAPPSRVTSHLELEAAGGLVVTPLFVLMPLEGEFGAGEIFARRFFAFEA